MKRSGMENTSPTSCSAHIARELQRRGLRGRRFEIKMRGLRELGRFIKTLDEASEKAAQSTTLYGQNH